MLEQISLKVQIKNIILKFFFLITIPCLLFSCLHTKPERSSSKYNVVLISADNLRADHLSLYGYRRLTTPFLDSWANSAQIFNNFYSTSTMTVTSEASAFTGLYPHENELLSFEHVIRPNIQTISSILASRGYRTLAYGDSPEYYNFPAIVESFKPQFEKFIMPPVRIKNYFNSPDREFDTSPIDEFLEVSKNENFFIWLPLGIAHSPFGFPFENKFSDPRYNGPLKFLETFPGGNLWLYKNILYPITPDTSFSFSFLPGQLMDRSILKHNQVKKQKISDKDVNWIVDRYDDGVYALDRQIKKIIDIFEKRDLTKNTIFVFYSNHGEEFNEHGYFGHIDAYQGNIHVPLIIKAPQLNDSMRHNMLASSIDILPTLLKLLNIDDINGLSGLDLFSKEATSRDSIYLIRTPVWESLIRVNNRVSIWDDFRNIIKTEDYMEPLILTSKYKLIHRRARFLMKKYSVFQFVSGIKINVPQYEMYDYTQDPDEQKNIADYSGDFKYLEKKLNNFETSITSKKYLLKKKNFQIQDYR